MAEASSMCLLGLKYQRIIFLIFLTLTTLMENHLLLLIIFKILRVAIRKHWHYLEFQDWLHLLGQILNRPYFLNIAYLKFILFSLVKNIAVHSSLLEHKSTLKPFWIWLVISWNNFFKDLTMLIMSTLFHI